MPAGLYHGSSKSGLTEIGPRAVSVRDTAEGAVVFATPDPAIASMFLVPVRQHSGRFNGVPYFVAIKADFEMRDLGGSIYTIKSDGFSFDHDKGLGELEWTCANSVQVVSETHYNSALQCMLEHGVQVFLVDKATFEQIDKAEDHGLSILHRCLSENVLRNINPQKF